MVILLLIVELVKHVHSQNSSSSEMPVNIDRNRFVPSRYEAKNDDENGMTLMLENIS